MIITGLQQLDYEFILYDIAGKSILSKTLSSQQFSQSVELNKINSGIYFYDVMSDGMKVKSGKVVKM